ncbi:unnamed protein product [Pylaiella littoralis]
MGNFDRPPSVAGHADYRYGKFHNSSPTGPLYRLVSECEEEAAANEEYRARILRPVLDFLLVAAMLLPWKLWWDLSEEKCWDPSSYKATELTLLRVTRGVWMVWLTHAAGLIDEALRVFLGIRLTMGLGSPTSVDKTRTKMSRRAEIVAEGIAVDDFPALLGLYAGAQPPGANKRSSSGTPSAGGGDDGASYEAGLAAARARVNRSLVMRVEKVAVTAQLWSLAPWSSVRRYERVHVKGITLRLRQVQGILNFSFVALKTKGSGDGAGAAVGSNAAAAAAAAASGGGGSAGAGGPADGGRRRLSYVGGGAGGSGGFVGAAAPEQSRSGSMEDLDGIDIGGEYATDTDEEEEEEENGRFEHKPVDGDAEPTDEAGGGGGGDGGVGSSGGVAGEVDEVNNDVSAVEGRQRLLSDPRSSSPSSVDEASLPPQSAKTFGGALGEGAQRKQAPWAAAAAAAVANSTAAAALGEHSSGGGAGAGAGAGVSGSGSGSRVCGRARSISLCVGRNKSSSSSDNLGNLGVFKVLGEAFMRRFNVYSDQVSAAFDRVSDIKVVPNLWRWGRRRGAKKRRRYEVGEIFLEDVCICVDSGVWNDLLGAQVGAAFSPEFRLSVHVGPKDLRTPDGKGQLPGDIGKLLNDKLVRLLSRLVMRETLKTSTLTSVVIASLALDTDARRRQQGRKSLSPPPVQWGEKGHGTEKNTLLPRRATSASGSDTADFPTSAAAAAAAAGEHRPGKFWRPFATPLRPSSAAAALAGESVPVSSSIGLSRNSSGGVAGAKNQTQNGGAGSLRQNNLPPPSSAEVIVVSSGSNASGAPPEDGGSAWDSGDGGRGWRTQRPKRSLPVIGKLRRNSEPPASSHLAPGKGVLSPPPRSGVRPRPSSVSGGAVVGGVVAGSDEDKTESAKSCLSGGKRAVGVDKGSAGSDVGIKGGVGADGGEESGGEPFETVAKVPPWMEGVEASAEYDEIKPTLDVIKQTVLLAMLQQTNESVDLSTPMSEGKEEALNAKHNSKSWGRLGCSRPKAGEEMLEGEGMKLEKRMQKELEAAKEAGGDVDRLVMQRLLAGVRDSGPNTAYKALASIELSSFLDNLSNGTRFAQHLENLGIDVNRVSRSLAGLTAGEMMEGVRDTAGKVGGQARRLRTEAVRMQRELLDETGILPLLNDAGGGGDDAASIASAMGLLSDALTGENNSGSGSSSSSGSGGGTGGSGTGGSGSGDNGSDPFVQDSDSWEKGVAVPSDPEEEGHSVESGLRSAGGAGDVEEVDQVDVIMQVLDLIDAVERLKKSIVEGGVPLGTVEQAVGKVAESIDVYLILAASESMLGFLLERLRKLPVGQAKFAGKGFEARVWNLDLEGVHVKRENVDLVMKGFRLPKRGTPVMTKFGPGKIKRYKKRSRCFVVNLEWKLRSDEPVKAYLQPNNIVILEGHEGGLSDEEEVDESGSTKVTVDHGEVDSTTLSTGGALDGSKGACKAGSGGGDTTFSSPPLRERSGSISSGSAPSLPPKSDRGGRWRSFPKLWNRRKSTAATATTVAAAAASAQDSHGLHARCEGAAATGGGDGGGGRISLVSDGATAGGTMARHTASAPVAIQSASLSSSPSTTACDGANGSDDTTCTAAMATERVEGVHPRGSVVVTGGSAGNVAGEKRTIPRAPPGTTTMASTTADPTRERPPGSGVDASEGEDGGRRCNRREDNRGAITSPNSADVLSAPFLVARISGVGAELKDIKWAVRQTHFPHLKTAGSLMATLSGLTIEVELDAQDLPAGRRKKHQDGGTANDGVPSGGNGSSSSGSGGDEGGSDEGGSPTGLKLTRLRVSVLAVKVHVKNNALSAVYNLAASAFEAAVKRYVVDNVEATVRKNITALLTIINTQLSAKWDVLCKVGGGGGGGNGGDPLNPVAVNAVEKVLAASLSHHLVWPTDSSGNTAPAPAAAAESIPVSDQPSRGQVPCLERTYSGSSRGSTDGRDSGGSGSSGGTGASVGTGAAASGTNSVRKRLAKQSFRILGSIGKPPSAEEMTKLLSPTSASASSSTTSIPKLASSSLPSSTSSGRAQLYTRPPGSPTLSSQNSSSTTLSESGTGKMPPPPPPCCQEVAPAEGAAAGRMQGRRNMWRRGEGSAPPVLEDRRRVSASPPLKQLRGLKRVRDADKDAGFCSDGGVVGRQREAATTKDYWRDSPANTAGVMSRRPAEGSIIVGDS